MTTGQMSSLPTLRTIITSSRAIKGTLRKPTQNTQNRRAASLVARLFVFVSSEQPRKRVSAATHAKSGKILPDFPLRDQILPGFDDFYQI